MALGPPGVVSEIAVFCPEPLVLHRLARVAYTLGVKVTVLAFVALSAPGLAGDTQLPALRAALLATQHAPDAADRVRGASPQLTIAKHQLRDWAESRLKSLPFGGDEAEFSRLLNADLRSAGLFWGDDAGEKSIVSGVKVVWRLESSPYSRFINV